MYIFLFGNKEYGPVPGSYNELSGRQLIAITRLFTAGLPEQLARLKALKVLLNKSLLSFAMIPADAKQRMLDAEASPQPSPHGERENPGRKCIDWIFDKNSLTEQLLPAYRGYYGSGKEFENLTLAEFHYTEMNYRQMVDNDDEEALNNLIAVLYRRPKPNYNFKLDPDGDSRRRFNANVIKFYSRKISAWPAEVKTAVMFYYDGCRQNLLESYPEIFKGDSGEDNQDGMFGIIRGLAGEKYGDIDKVEVLNIHTALYELTLQVKEAAPPAPQRGE